MVEKKKWFDIEIPLLKTSVKLIGYSAEDLNNRVIRLDLTRQLRGKSMEAVIKVKVENGKAVGDISELNLFPFFIRRMMRNSISYVESSFSPESLDAVLKVKFFLITRKRVTRAVRNALRIAGEQYITEYLKDKGTEEIFYDILNNKLQKSMSLKLKKIYPLALCEIRMINIEKVKEGVVIEKFSEKIEKRPQSEAIEEEKSQIEEIEEEQKKARLEEEKSEGKEEE